MCRAGLCSALGTHTHTLEQSAEVSGYLTVDLQGDGRAFAVQREEGGGGVAWMVKQGGGRKQMQKGSDEGCAANSKKTKANQKYTQ